jgi:uncharacterized repeat protein (TIGR03803 family)
LYQFSGGADGANPLLGDIAFDQHGSIYGTTQTGGGTGCGGLGCGTVFELTQVSGGWLESVLYRFSGEGNDGANPFAGVILDDAGNLYGTTKFGGQGANGTIFRLSPNGSGWSEGILYAFQGGDDGYWPLSGVLLDSSGSLIGSTTSGGANSGGTAFLLTTSGTMSVLHGFAGQPQGGPYGSLTRDAAGTLYGMTYDDGAYGNGSVFKLTSSSNGWVYTDVYDFTGGTDGRCPYGGVTIDADGNLYGTAEEGGANDSGVVWRITPQ